MTTIQGDGRAAGLRFALIVSKYNDFVTDRLQAGAMAALSGAGAASSDVTVIRVPGAFDERVGKPHAAGRRIYLVEAKERVDLGGMDGHPASPGRIRTTLLPEHESGTNLPGSPVSEWNWRAAHIATP